MDFHVFSALIFALIFYHVFNGKWTKNGCPYGTRVSLLAPFFATFSEHRVLDAFWSTLGSPLAPFGLPLAPFWLPLPPFWLPLTPFWLPWSPFWLPLAHFWRPFGTLRGHFLTFGSILASLLHFSRFLVEKAVAGPRHCRAQDNNNNNNNKIKEEIYN